MTKGQQEFLDQITRKMLVEWCLLALPNLDEDIPIPNQSVITTYAVSKKWLSPKSPGTFRILGAGWDTAARFLRR